MFGNIAGWPEIKDGLRVNRYVPYNGLSELATTGYGVLAMYFISVGFLLKGMERYFYRSFLGIMVVMCISGLFTVEILQYNLNNALENEEYETAAEIRDIINSLKDTKNQ